MEVYADESGIHGGSERCVLAGYAGGRRKWISFENAWSSLLRQFGIPAEIGFHAKTFFKISRDGRRFCPYEGWDKPKADEFLKAIIRIINEHGIYPAGAYVDIAYWNSLSVNLRRWLTGGFYNSDLRKWTQTGAPTKPYFFAFQEVVVGGASGAQPGVQVDFIFDRQDSFHKHALNLWNWMKSLDWKTGTHLGGISFFSRFERIALQAADLLAFCAYRGDAYRRDTQSVELAYAIHYLVAGKEHMKRFDKKAVALLLPAYPKELKEADERQERIRQLRRGDAANYPSKARRDKDEAGSGETSEAEEAEV